MWTTNQYALALWGFLAAAAAFVGESCLYSYHVMCDTVQEWIFALSYNSPGFWYNRISGDIDVMSLEYRVGDVKYRMFHISDHVLPRVNRVRDLSPHKRPVAHH
jgi:hypothetical protein